MRCALRGKAISIRETATGPRRSAHFRCRMADAGGAPCTGTQVRAIHIDETVRSVLKEPGSAFPSRRGRPTRPAVRPRSPGGSLPLLDPTAERKFLREAVREVIWNADT